MIHESQVSLYGPCFLSWPVGIHSQTNQKYYPVTLLRNNFKTTSQKNRNATLYATCLYIFTQFLHLLQASQGSLSSGPGQPTDPAGPTAPSTWTKVGGPSKSALGREPRREEKDSRVRPEDMTSPNKTWVFHTMKKKKHRSIYIESNNPFNIFRVEQQRRDILIYIFIYPSKECNRRTHVFFSTDTLLRG